MLGDAILYAVRSATSTAVGNVERKVAWTAAAGASLLCALVAALLVAFQLLAQGRPVERGRVGFRRVPADWPLLSISAQQHRPCSA
jgi:hypothetical protein